MFWTLKENKKLRVFIHQFCFVFILLVLTSCATNIVNLDTQAIQESKLRQTHSLQTLIDYFPTNTFNAQQLVELYGEPVSINYIPYLNDHNAGQIDGISTYIFESFEFSVYHVASNDNALLMDLVVRSPDYKLPLGIQVGSSLDDVLTTLGIPYDRHNDISIYLLADTTETLLLTIKENTVVEIMWQFYWD